MSSGYPAFSFPSIRRLLWVLWWENLEMNYCEPCETRLCFFPGGSVVKNLPAIAGDVGLMGLIPGLGRSPGEWYGNTCLESPKDRGAWGVSVHKVAKSRTWLSNRTLTHTNHIHLWNICIPWWLSGKESCLPVKEMWVWTLGQEDPLEKEITTHSSNFAWKTPWTEESGGLQSMWSERVGHNWVTEQQQNQP